MTEETFTFDCEGEQLLGILHRPDQAPKVGILMIVGGPQYRVGSHRQFVEYARAQCDNGYAVLRFDYRGMGDSEGPFLNFKRAQKDILRAMEELFRQVPSLTSTVWFGLCDGAAASLMHVPDDPRIRGLMLLNPWARNSKTQAQAVVKHYYRQRLLSSDFWKKLVTGRAQIFESLRSLAGNLSRSVTASKAAPQDFRTQMLHGAQRFDGDVLLILSADDLTANEFRGMVTQSAEWSAEAKSSKWQWQSVPTANHTFANSGEKKIVIDMCSRWLEKL
ncbi:MAG: hydrolase 1, exosortase A system-associated [Gammaproteobacteria bacterium]